MTDRKTRHTSGWTDRWRGEREDRWLVSGRQKLHQARTPMAPWLEIPLPGRQQCGASPLPCWYTKADMSNTDPLWSRAWPAALESLSQLDDDNGAAEQIMVDHALSTHQQAGAETVCCSCRVLHWYPCPSHPKGHTLG